MKITLSINAQEVKLVAGDGRAVRVWISERLENGLVQDGRIMDPQQVGEIIAQMFISQKLPRSQITVALSGLPYTYRVLELPYLKSDQVEEAILRSLPSELTIPLEELYISWDPLVHHPDSVDYFALGVDRELADAVIETMKAAGIRDWMMDLKPLALARAAAATDAIVASLDYDYMEIVLMDGGYVRELHSTEIDRGQDKTDYDAYIEQFTSEVVKLLSYYQNNTATDVNLAELPVIITGEFVAEFPDEEWQSSNTHRLTDKISQIIGHPVYVMAAPVIFPATFNPHAFTANIGLLLKNQKRKVRHRPDATVFQDINIDVLSGMYQSKPARVPAWWVAVPVTLFVMAVAGWSVNSAFTESASETSSLQAELDRLNIELVQVQRENSHLQELQVQLETSREALAMLEEDYAFLLEGKGQDTVNVSMVRANLPENTYLTWIMTGESSIQLTGISSSPYDIITYVKSLEAAGYAAVDLNELGTQGEAEYSFRITIWTETEEEPST